MLASATQQVNKTSIMYRANLSYAQLIEHLTYLIEKKMLIKQGGLYFASEKGRAYVDAYQKIQEIIAN